MCDNLDNLSADNVAVRYGGVGRMGGGPQAFAGKETGKGFPCSGAFDGMAVCTACCPYRLEDLYDDGYGIPIIFRQDDTNHGESTVGTGVSLADRLCAGGGREVVCRLSAEASVRGLCSLYGRAGGAFPEGLLAERDCGRDLSV